MSNQRDIDRMIATKEAELSGGDVDDNVVWLDDNIAGFREFCESPSYLNTFPLSDEQYLDIESLIGTDPKKTFHPSRTNDLLVLVYGKGGGKGLCIARAFTYLVYLLENLGNPQAFLFDVQDKASRLTLLNVAKKEKQAERVFFGYFTSLIKTSPWFREHFEIKDKNHWHSRIAKKSHYKGTIHITSDAVMFPNNV